MDDVVHLKVCSEYSLLYSAARIKEVAHAARAEGMTALGIADRGGMFGAVTTYRTIREAGLTPLFGATVAGVKERTRGKATETPMELGLIADRAEGYGSLTALATAAAMAEHGDALCNTWQEVFSRPTGLLCLTGGSQGPVAQAVLTGTLEQAERSLQQLQEVFGKDRVYVELSCVGLAIETELNRILARVARLAGAPLVATSCIRHLKAEDIRLIDILQGIKYGINRREANGLRQAGVSYHFRTQEEMQKLFLEFPEALANTREIALRAAFTLPFGDLQMPRYPVSAGSTEDDVLRQAALAGLRERLPGALGIYRERLDHELNVIRQMGFAGYFLIVWDFMKFAHEQAISTGPGRGSAAGSLVAYALRITDVDPVARQLLFERFLNPERVSWPDIDIDFETERRHEVIAYVARKYGADRVAQIGTLGTFAARAAIRDVGRVLETPQTQIEQLVRHIPSGPSVTLQGALQGDGSLRALVQQSPMLSRVLELAEGIEGLPRHSSIHAAGVVIADRPLANHVPLLRGPEDIPVTQYSMEDIESMGLLKMDFLGLRTLTICDRALRYIRQLRGIEVVYDEERIDEKTLALLAAGDTDGCFQLESNGVKQVLKELRPETLEDIIAVISLYRPGPMEQIGAFIKARRSVAPVKHEPAVLGPILAPTYGILVYQEQIMQIAAVMAGFTLGQADVLRRAVSKKKRETLDEGRMQFVQGCLQQGHSNQAANEVYDLIVRFADYGFNRSHAAAYAVLAYRTAYLKANFRAEFMASLITDSVSRPEKVAQYALACMRADVPVLAPHINRSLGECAPEWQENGTMGVRLGLYAIKNVGVSAVENILRERADHGPFSSLQDLGARLDARAVTKRVLECLIQGGAFAELGHSRMSLLRQLETLPKQSKERRNTSQLSLLEPETKNAPADAVKNTGEADDPRKIAEWERDLLGFVVSLDPYAQVRQVQKALGVEPIAEVQSQIGNGKMGKLAEGQLSARFVGAVAALRTVTTKKGEPMAFLTLEDASARVETILFPSVLRLIDPLPEIDQLVDLTVRKNRQGDSSWIVSTLQQADAQRQQEHSPTLYIKVSLALESEQEQMKRLREALLRHPGEHSVVLVYESGKIRHLDTVRVRQETALLTVLQKIAGADAVKWRKESL